MAYKLKKVNPDAFSWPWEVREGYASTGSPKKEQKNPLPALFTSYKLKEHTLKNRLVVSPMCQYTSDDGFMNDWHLVHLGGLARGGAALVFTEAAAVEDIGRITPSDAGIWKDEHIPFMARIVHFIHANKALAGIQLAHAGRKASTKPPFFVPRGSKSEVDQQDGWTPVGPTNEQWGEGYPVPHELTKEEIHRIVKAFGSATERAIKGGFDVIEIHGAHGYLINSFLSPIVNKRTDEYGQTFEGRTRFCQEIVKEVKKVWGQRPLFLRISSTDWVEGGWTVEDSVKLAKVVKDLGVDVLDCSSGGNSPKQQIKESPGYQVPFAERVKKELPELGVAAVGKITDAKQANEIVESGKADLVVIARELLRDPNFPMRAAAQLGVDVDYPLQYERAKF